MCQTRAIDSLVIREIPTITSDIIHRGIHVINQHPYITKHKEIRTTQIWGLRIMIELLGSANIHIHVPSGQILQNIHSTAHSHDSHLLYCISF